MMVRETKAKILINGKPYAGEVDVAMQPSDTPDFPRMNPDRHGSITIKLKKDESRKLRRFIRQSCGATMLKRLRKRHSLFVGRRITRRKAKMILQAAIRIEKTKMRALI
jgi:hypothetical protein